jgi:hypothetical protein
VWVVLTRKPHRLRAKQEPPATVLSEFSSFLFVS